MQITNDSLLALMASTQDLYDRFGVAFTVRQAVRVFAEEANELQHAAKRETTEQVANEFADVLVTGMAICLARDVSYADITQAIQRTIAKNDAKTHDTHHVNRAGKIARKRKA